MSKFDIQREERKNSSIALIIMAMVVLVLYAKYKTPIERSTCDEKSTVEVRTHGVLSESAPMEGAAESQGSLAESRRAQEMLPTTPRLNAADQVSLRKEALDRPKEIADVTAETPPEAQSTNEPTPQRARTGFAEKALDPKVVDRSQPTGSVTPRISVETKTAPVVKTPKIARVSDPNTAKATVRQQAESLPPQPVITPPPAPEKPKADNFQPPAPKVVHRNEPKAQVPEPAREIPQPKRIATVQTEKPAPAKAPILEPKPEEAKPNQVEEKLAEAKPVSPLIYELKIETGGQTAAIGLALPEEELSQDEIKKLTFGSSSIPFAVKQREIHKLTEEFRKELPVDPKQTKEERKAASEKRYRDYLANVQKILEK